MADVVGRKIWPSFDSGRVLGPGPRSRARFINETPPPRRHAVVRPLPVAARVGAVEARGRECQPWLEKQRGRVAQLVPGLESKRHITLYSIYAFLHTPAESPHYLILCANAQFLSCDP